MSYSDKILRVYGMWLSLVERCVRDAEAASSNLVIPTIIITFVDTKKSSLYEVTSLFSPEKNLCKKPQRVFLNAVFICSNHFNKLQPYQFSFFFIVVSAKTATDITNTATSAVRI